MLLACQSHVLVSFGALEYTANADAIGTLRNAHHRHGKPDQILSLSGVFLGALRRGSGGAAAGCSIRVCPMRKQVIQVIQADWNAL
jgi:hypothetical protein